MTSIARVGPVAAFLSIWLLAGLAFSKRDEPRARTAPTDASVAQTVGMAGCAATGCHGRPDVRHTVRDADTWHESFALWLDRDPHTRAYAVLEGSLAKSIMQRLAADPAQPVPATKDARCLACHSTPSLANEAAMQDDRLNLIRAEGVSCEACHGNAERWQIAHTNPIPRDGRTAQLDAWQMNDLNRWDVQAMTCAGCHVGAPEDKSRGLPVRDMNHDMIAAGHPRLEFDFPSYQARLAGHWQPKHRGSESTDPGRDTRLHAWLQGQIATEKAYCELSLDRIARANTDRSPYPEFADWNCSQCHHNLVSAPWREQAVKAQTTGTGAIRSLGRPAWIGSSAFSAPAPVAKFGDSLANQKAALESRLKVLRELHEKIASNPQTEVRRTVQDFLARDSSHPLNWEEATRTFLTLKSLDACLRAAGATPSNENLVNSLRATFWGSPDEPSRKEHAAKGYHRKPESRWNWETDPKLRPDSVVATLESLKKALMADLQKLPTDPSKR